MEFIKELVDVLKDDVQFVHVFAIVLDGSPSAFRSTLGVDDMLRLFGRMFSNRFWRQAQVVATFYSFGQDAIDARALVKPKPTTEDSWEKTKIEALEEKIPYLKKVSSY